MNDRTNRRKTKQRSEQPVAGGRSSNGVAVEEAAPLLRARTVLRSAGMSAPERLESNAARIRLTGGRALPTEARERMEAAFDHDFSHVKVHDDSAADHAARGLDAAAFALGADVFFASGNFAPGTMAGDRLLAHELTHVVQHDQGRISGSGVSSPDDPLEQEAYASETRVVQALQGIDAASGLQAVEVAVGAVPDAVADHVAGRLGGDGGAGGEDPTAGLVQGASALGADAFDCPAMRSLAPHESDPIELWEPTLVTEEPVAIGAPDAAGDAGDPARAAAEVIAQEPRFLRRCRDAVRATVGVEQEAMLALNELAAVVAETGEAPAELADRTNLLLEAAGLVPDEPAPPGIDAAEHASAPVLERIANLSRSSVGGGGAGASASGSEGSSFPKVSWSRGTARGGTATTFNMNPSLG